MEVSLKREEIQAFIELYEACYDVFEAGYIAGRTSDEDREAIRKCSRIIGRLSMIDSISDMFSNP